MKCVAALLFCFIFNSSAQASSPTTTVLSTSPANPSYGTVVQLTATISPSSATGTATFYDGPYFLGIATLTAGTAVFQTPLLDAGNHSLTARYNGDSVDLTSLSAPQPLSVTAALGGTFSAAAALPTSFYPLAIAAGDFNGDGKADVVTADEVSNQINVMLGNGDATFQSAVAYAAGSKPSSVVVADVNGDGKPDVVVANAISNDVGVLLGNGDGTFQAAISYSVPNSPRTVVVGDFNGDGFPDLAVTTTLKKNVAILLNTGAGTFSAAVTYAIPGAPKGLTVGDFRGTGVLDLAVTSSSSGSNYVSILLGQGDGTFLAAVNYSTGSGPVDVISSDFNGDGKADLAVVNSADNSVSILLGNGDGTFPATAPAYAVGTGPFAIVVSDFNGDLQPDIAVVNNTSNTISVLVGNPDGTFQPQTTFPTGSAPTGLVAAALNSDTRVDLAVSNSISNTVSILLGIQPTTTVLAVSPNPATPGQSVTLIATVAPSSAVGNVTFYDGSTVLAVVPLTGGTALFATTTLSTAYHSLSATYAGSSDFAPSTSAATSEKVGNDATATLVAAPATSTLGQPVTLTVTVTPSAAGGKATFYDGTAILGEISLVSGQASLATSLLSSGTHSLMVRYNGDSLYLPVASAVTTVTVTTSPGGGFAAPVTYSAGAGPSAIVAADFNVDGLADVATTNASGNNISVLLGNSGGTFQAAVNYAVGAHPGPLAAGDLNSDGKQDIVTSNYTDSTLSVLMGVGDGTFSAASTLSLPTGGLPLGVTIADFNGDGNPDIAVADSGTNQVSLLLGNGDGTFQAAKNITVGTGLAGTASADLNGDLKADLVVTTGSGVYVLLGNGDGTFATPVNYAAGSGSIAVAVADLGNGRLDLIVVNSLTNNISVLLGNGDGTFQSASTFAVGNFPQSIAVADFNGDGKPDVVVSNEVDGTVSLLLGNGDGTFKSASTFTDATGANPTGLVTAGVQGNGQAGLVVANFQTNNVAVMFALSPSTLTLTANPNPDPSAAPITLTAAISPNTATGSVTFFDGATSLGSSPLSGGVASLIVALSAGSHTLTATYSGDSNFGPSASPAVIDLISQSATVVTFSVPSSPVVFGRPLTLTATVNNTSAAGNVTFYSGTLVIGEAPVSNGVAVLQTLTLPVGAQSLTARYNGAGNLASSVSPAVSLTVATQPGYTLATAQNFSAGTSPVSVAAADFNGDGKIDLAVANIDVAIMLGNGDGTFGAATNIEAGSGPTQVLAADFNGDGKADLAVSDSAGNGVSILLGKGDGTFQTAVPYATGVGPSSLATADFNRDGIPDLAVANRNGGNVSILLGNGDGTFRTPLNVIVGASNLFIASGDFNGDGIADLAVADLPANAVWVMLGNGDGTFRTPVSNPVGSGPIALTVGDFNGDGQADIGVANQSGQNVSVLLGVGDGTFNGAVTYISGPGTQFITEGDLNGDGILDLVVANQPNSINVLLGKGDGTFLGAAPFTVGSNPVSLLVGNFNGDGTAQVAAANQGSGNVSVLLETPVSLSTVQGTPQTTNAGSTFSTALQVRAIGFGAPAAGVSVTFVAPTTGASGFFPGSGTTVTVLTGADGIATAPVLAANGQTGAYTVNASTGPASVSFSLTNAPSTCAYAITPASLNYDSAGGATAATVTATGSSCNWGAASDSPWITLSNSGGTGAGAVTISIAPNATGVERLGNVLVGGQVVPVNEWATAQVFTDVSPSDYYFDAANTLYAKGITAGCGTVPLEFCPGTTLTRDQMAIFLVRAAYGSDNFTSSPTPYFNDVAPDAFAFKWIQKLSELGITAGCGSGNYCPGDSVTRDQLAIFLVRDRLGSSVIFGYNPTPYFTDVGTDNYAFPWIQRIKQDQITAGCGPTTYCPGLAVSRGDLAILLLRAAFNQLMPANYPVISQISQSTIGLSQTVTLSVTGLKTSFVQGTTALVSFPGVTFGPVTVINPTLLSVQATVSGTAATQPYSIVVATGAELDVLPNGLLVQ